MDHLEFKETTAPDPLTEMPQSGLGVASFFQRDRKRALAAVGVSLSVIFLALIALIMWVGTAS